MMKELTKVNHRKYVNTIINLLIYSKHLRNIRYNEIDG
jgi:hypothetical protein